MNAKRNKSLTSISTVVISLVPELAPLRMSCHSPSGTWDHQARCLLPTSSQVVSRSPSERSSPIKAVCETGITAPSDSEAFANPAFPSIFNPALKHANPAPLHTSRCQLDQG